MADGASIEKERRRKRERTVTKECRANRVDEQHPPKKMKMNSTNRHHPSKKDTSKTTKAHSTKDYSETAPKE